LLGGVNIMGLDQWMKKRKGDVEEEIAYWHKHPNLQGWMKELWSKDHIGEFNLTKVFLSKEDLDELERVVKSGTLSPTSGFLFGDDFCAHYYAHDLEAIEKARQAIDEGFDVYYESWW